MRTRTKKMLSLLLAAAMVFTMNSFAFAAETIESEAVIAEEGAVIADAKDTSCNASANWNPTVSADKTLSDNIATISSNVQSYTSIKVGEYYIVYPTAVAWDGQKVGSKKSGIKLDSSTITVYKASDATVSAANLISENEAGFEVPNTVSAAKLKKLDIKKIKIKAQKGATVTLEGKPVAAGLKKATYISSITLTDKTENKALKSAMKTMVKAIKKDKSSSYTLSENEFVDASNKTVDATNLVIAVYPAYGGNDKDAIEVAKAGKLNVLSVTKDKLPKKLSGTVGSKKVTLKVTKKAGKPKGINGAAKTCTADTNSLKATSYYELDGNFAGNYYAGSASK
jgi:hypothetical protein